MNDCRPVKTWFRPSLGSDLKEEATDEQRTDEPTP